MIRETSVLGECNKLNCQWRWLWRVKFSVNDIGFISGLSLPLSFSTWILFTLFSFRRAFNDKLGVRWQRSDIGTVVVAVVIVRTLTIYEPRGYVNLDIHDVFCVTLSMSTCHLIMSMPSLENASTLLRFMGSSPRSDHSLLRTQPLNIIWTCARWMWSMFSRSVQHETQLRLRR